MLIEAHVTFINPRNCSGASRTERSFTHNMLMLAMDINIKKAKSPLYTARLELRSREHARERDQHFSSVLKSSDIFYSTREITLYKQLREAAVSHSWLGGDIWAKNMVLTSPFRVRLDCCVFWILR